MIENLGNEPLEGRKGNGASPLSEDPQFAASHAAAENLREARVHLKEAAGATAEATRKAAAGAGEALREGATKVKAAVSEAAHSARAASHEATAVAREGMHAAADAARSLRGRTEEVIRQQPLTAIGVAFITGWLISRALQRRSGSE